MLDLPSKIAKIFFVLRLSISPTQWIYNGWLRFHGMKVGRGARLGQRATANWPHQVSIGAKSTLQNDISFEYCHGEWRLGPSIVIGDHCFIGRYCEFNVRVGVRIGHDCLIASGCKFIDHDHGLAADRPMNQQDGPEAAIVIEDDVWLGVNVVVLKGVTIGRGAVVAAGAVVTKPVPPMEIWGGVPARRLSLRQNAERK